MKQHDVGTVDMPISENTLRLTRIAVFLFLLVSAGTVFLLGDRIWLAVELGSLPAWVGFVAPIGFTVFVFFFLLDRIFQVKQGRYPMIRAFIQVVLSLIFLVIIWPQQTKAFQMHQHLDLSDVGLMELLNSRDPRVRALSCEVISYRKVGNSEVLAKHAKNDISAEVRRVCSKALEQLEPKAD